MGEVVPLGAEVPPWGKVSAVAMIEGERYYFLVDGRRDVSMVPADVVESATHQTREDGDG